MSISRALFLGLFLVTSACGLAMSNEERLDRAAQAMADGDFRAAIIDAKDVLRDEPDNVRGRLLLARASIGVSDAASAEKEFRRALGLGTGLGEIATQFAQSLLAQGKFAAVIDEIPLDAANSEGELQELSRLHGDAHLGLGQPEQARISYQKALEIQPDDVQSQLGIISSYVAEENFVQARGVLDQVQATHGDQAAVWIFAGRLNSRLADHAQAESDFRRALDLLAPGDGGNARLDAIVGVANSLLDQGKQEAARPLVEELMERAPRAQPAMLLAARVAFVDQDWETAQQHLQGVLSMYPDNNQAQMLLGAVHLQSGSLEQAEMYLSAAVAAQPDNISARRLLAETQLQQQKGGEASRMLRPLVAGGDADARTLELAARASMALDDVDDAVRYLEAAIKQDPTDADLRFQLAAALMQAGRISESETVLDEIDTSGSEDLAYRKDAMVILRALQEDKLLVALEAAKALPLRYDDRANAYNLLGAVQLRNGQATNAESSFESAVSLDPDNLVALRYLARIDEVKGNSDAATARYTEILDFYPQTDWALAGLARIALRNGNLEEGRAYYRRALDIAPDNNEHRVNLARIERREDNAAEAKKVLETSPSNVIEHIPSGVELAMLKAKSGDTDAALELAKDLQRAHPNSPVPFALEGEIYLMLENVDLALSGYDQAVSLGPFKSHALRLYRIQRDLGHPKPEQPLMTYLEERPLDTDVRLVLAQYFDSENDRERAIAEYETIIRAKPDSGIALNNLAWHYFLSGDKRALAAADTAGSLMPGNPAVLDTAGWIQVHMGSVEEGEALLRRAVELSGGDAEIRYHHAAALAKLGDSDEARRILESLLKSEQSFVSRPDAEILIKEL